MDKRVLIAAGLSVLILVLWSQVFPPPKPSQPTKSPVVEANPPAAEPRDAIVDPPPDEPEPGPPTQTDPISAVSVENILVENDLFQVALSNKGGVATSWRLIDSTTGDAPLELLPQSPDKPFEMLTVDLDDPGMARQLNEALYRIERTRLSATSNVAAGERVSFHWSDGRGLEVDKSLTFRQGSYLVKLAIDVTDRGRRLPARLYLGPGFGAQDAVTSGLGSYYYQAILFNGGGEVTHRRKSKLDAEIDGIAGAIRWAGLEDQYFAAILLPNEATSQVLWRSVEMTPAARPDSDDVPEVEAFAALAMTVPEGGARLFVGPKKYQLLQELGDELEKAVWFSSYGLLSWISRHIFFGLLWMHANTVQNYGVAIILCTVLLRLLLFPVNQYSMVSMKKSQMQMQKLQPKIKAIRAKFKKQKDAESRQKMNEEMMGLYKREGVNPMGGLSGCLPLFAQFPILMGFYFMLTVAVELRGAPFFGWIVDLSSPEPLFIKPLPLLMGATMFLQQKMAMSKVKDPVQQQQQKFMMIMPFVFTWICMQMPAGMVLYWFVNNLLGIGQQYLVNRHTTRLEAAEQKA